jgi:hypothetical protein
MTRTARPHARPAAPAKQPGGNRTAIVATVLGLATTCLLGWLWLTSGEDLVDKTLKMERTLLAGEASGRAGKKAVDEIIRNVDRMDPAELKQVQQTLEAEWQRGLLRRQAGRTPFDPRPQHRPHTHVQGTAVRGESPGMEQGRPKASQAADDISRLPGGGRDGRREESPAAAARTL